MPAAHLKPPVRVLAIRFPRWALGLVWQACGFFVVLFSGWSAGIAPPEFFDPEREYDLGGLVDLALRNDPQVAGAWNRARAAEAAAGEARAPYWPQIEARFLGGSDQWYTPAAPGVDNFRRVQATVILAAEYLLFDFGRRDAEAARTTALLEAAGLLYQRRLQETIFAVQVAWFAHEAARWQETAARAAQESARVTLETLERETDTGLRAAPELLLARKAEWQARFRLEEAENAVKITRGQLCLAAGLSANASLRTRVGIRPPRSPLWRESVHQLIAQSLEARPDLAARAAEVRASAQSVRRARAEFYPEVRLEGNYAFSTFGYRAESGRTGGTYTENLNGYGGFLSASWELFDGGERLNRLRREKATEALRADEYRESQLSATAEVWQSYHDLLTAGTLVDFTEAWVTSAREDFAAIEAGFSTGLEDLATREEMRGRLAQAEYELANALANYSISLARLVLALGQGRPPGLP